MFYKLNGQFEIVSLVVLLVTWQKSPIPGAVISIKHLKTLTLVS